MKKISAFLLSAILLALFTFIPVSAATNGYPDKSEFFDKSEYSEVLEVVSGADIFNKNEKIDEKIAEAFKVYLVSSEDLNAAKNGGELFSKTDGGFYWKLYTKNGTVIKVIKKDGKWSVAGYSTEGEIKTATPEISAIFEKYAKNKKGTDLRVFECAQYYITLVCVSENGVVKVIPYSTREDFTGLENGKEYSFDNVKSALKENLASENLTDKNDNAGVPAKENEKNFPVFILIIAVAIPVCIAIAIPVFKKRKKNA